MTSVYTHRSGRTGRAGKTGTSISIIHTKEKGKVAQIEKLINKQFEKRSIPKGDLICEKQLFNFVDKIEKVKVNEAEIERLLPSIFRKLEWLEKEDIIKRIVSLEFNRLIDYYGRHKRLTSHRNHPAEEEMNHAEKEVTDKREDHAKLKKDTPDCLLMWEKWTT